MRTLFTFPRRTGAYTRPATSPYTPPLTRGFTLIEVVVVVVIIGVFAALAIPQVTRQMQDRRVHEAAQRLVHVYRDARLRALGRGGAVLVRYDLDGPTSRFQIRDGRLGGTDAAENCAFMPNPSCTDVAWDTPGETHAVSTMLIGAGGGLENARVDVLRNESTAAEAFMDVCFTPAGRTFVRYAALAPWVPLTEVPMAEVYRGSGSTRFGLTRRVLILPSGAARLAL